MDPCADFNPLDLGDQESGIDLAYDMSVILNGTLDEQDLFGQAEAHQKDASLVTPPSSLNYNYYQLKSKPVNESVPPTQTSGSYKGMPRSRTNFKQELMREQTVQEEKRQAELKQREQQARQNLQSASVPFQPPPLNNVDVPPQVLQVKTRLENPTFYYLKHSQQRQVRQYLNHSVSGSVPQSPVSSPLTGRQTDARNGLSALSSPHLQQRLQLNGPFAVSAPPTLLNSTPSGTSSPAPQSSLATSLNSIGSEGGAVEADLVEDILSLEADRPNVGIVDTTKFFSPTGKGVSDPSFAVLNFGLDSQDSPGGLDGSAPVSPNDDHVRQAQAKDRQKKDNHNMIERRRRFNINDRIKELGTLLPRNQDDPYFEQVGEFRPNKGTILKASVDYIKLLKGDSEKLKPLEAELKRSEQEIRRQLIRIQELEKLLKLNGIHINESPESSWRQSNESPTEGVKPELITVKKEPELINHCDGVEGMLVLDDLMEDDNTVVTGSVDPILTQTLGSLDEIHSQQLHDRMDFY